MCLYPLVRIAYAHTTTADVRELSLAWHWFWLLWCGYVSVTNQVRLANSVPFIPIFADTQVVTHILWPATACQHITTHAHHPATRSPQIASCVTARSELLHHDRLAKSAARRHRLLATGRTDHHCTHRFGRDRGRMCIFHACRCTASIGRHEMGDGRQSRLDAIRPTAYVQQ